MADGNADKPMSAPSIPNLLSLRGSRGGGASRGSRSRGRGGGGGHSAPTAAAAQDATIRDTDTDAAVSRLSAVDVGYLDDPYAQYFVQSDGGPPTRRLPIINRGTYTRTAALDVLVSAFLSEQGHTSASSSSQPRQIISLGAGTDTRSFRIFSRQGAYRAVKSTEGLVYHEIDFEVVSRKKLRTVQGIPALSRILGIPVEGGSTSWSSRPAQGGEFHCHGVDLRNIAAASSSSTSSASEILPGLRIDIPTLLISECCLCYLTPSDASSVLSFFTRQIPSLGLVIYEPTRPNDAFGKVMTSNLAARRIRMPTLEAYPEPNDQVARLKDAGFEVSRQMTIGEIWNAWVNMEEKERVDMLEGLDEVEEWELLAAHYVVVWGAKGEGFGGWDLLPGGA